MQVDQCVKCARKHVRQAAICWLESQKGHPDKWDMVQGHLAEAEDALIGVDNTLAAMLRDQRINLETDMHSFINFNYIFEQFDSLFQSKGEYYANGDSTR